jgi:hypothetical protein
MAVTIGAVKLRPAEEVQRESTVRLGAPLDEDSSGDCRSNPHCRRRDHRGLVDGPFVEAVIADQEAAQADQRMQRPRRRCQKRTSGRRGVSGNKTPRR